MDVLNFCFDKISLHSIPAWSLLHWELSPAWTDSLWPLTIQTKADVHGLMEPLIFSFPTAWQHLLK